MAAGYSGRIFRAAVGDRQRLGMIWDGQIYDLDLWAIPKGAKNKDGAKRFIAFATDPARLAAQAQLIAYGPMRKSALELVGKHPVIDVEMKDFLPTAPDNFKKALQFDDAGGARMARSCKSASRSGAVRFRPDKASRHGRRTEAGRAAPPAPRKRPVDPLARIDSDKAIEFRCRRAAQRHRALASSLRSCAHRVARAARQVSTDAATEKRKCG